MDACSRRRELSSRHQASTPPTGAGTSVDSGGWEWSEWNASVPVAFGPEWRTIEEVGYGRTEIGHSSAPSRGAYCLLYLEGIESILQHTM